MRRKGLVTLALTVGLVLAGSFSSFAGQLVKENDIWKYIDDDGTYATNTWREDCFQWYYFDENGCGSKVLNDWIEDNGKTCFVDILGSKYKNGYLYKNQFDEWITPMDIYFLKDYYTITAYYYLDEDGSLLKNQWLKNKNGNWRYFGEDGKMLVNTTTPDGYEVNNSGYWTVNGVVQVQ